MEVTKVKAHATQAMVEGGVITEVDRWGNQLADEAAKCGARCRPSLDDFLARLKVRRGTSELCAQWLRVGAGGSPTGGVPPSRIDQGPEDGEAEDVDEEWAGCDPRCGLDK